MPSYLQIENISKAYGPKILFEHIGFNINEGDKIALIAPNGTGKTSLLRILAGEDKSDSGGRVLFLKDIRIAFLQQDYAYDPARSIEEQILTHAASTLATFHEEELRDLNCNFDRCCPFPHKEEVILEPKELIERFQEENGERNAKINRILARVISKLEGNKGRRKI